MADWVNLEVALVADIRDIEPGDRHGKEREVSWGNTSNIRFFFFLEKPFFVWQPLLLFSSLEGYFGLLPHKLSQQVIHNFMLKEEGMK